MQEYKCTQIMPGWGSAARIKGSGHLSVLNQFEDLFDYFWHIVLMAQILYTSSKQIAFKSFCFITMEIPQWTRNAVLLPQIWQSSENSHTFLF